MTEYAKYLFDTLNDEQKMLVYSLVDEACTISAYLKVKRILTAPYETVIDRVIFNPPATIVFWSDGTKTIAKCDEKDIFNKEAGLFVCMAKKAFGKNYVGKVIRTYGTTEAEAAGFFYYVGKEETSMEVSFDLFTKHIPNKAQAAKVYRAIPEVVDKEKFLALTLAELSKRKGMGRKTLESVAAIQLDLIGK